MAEIDVVTTTIITLNLTDEEIDELGDQLSFLVGDNRGTDVTSELLHALNRAGY